MDVKYIYPKKVDKLNLGSILGIIVGLTGFAAGIRSITADFSDMWFGFVMMALGIIAVVGSCFAFSRRYFILAIVGGICAVLDMIPLLFYGIGIIGIVPLILIATSKREFKM